MVKYELKTKLNDGDVKAFLNSIEHEKRREDGLKMLDIMQEVTKEEPKMWGKTIVGFGTYHYTNKSGFDGEWMATGFSPRKQSLTLYIMAGFEKNKDLMEKLGKFKTGKSCLYINKLEDIDLEILKKVIKSSYDYVKKYNKGC